MSALMPALAMTCVRPRCLIWSKANHMVSRNRPLTNGTAMEGSGASSGREHGSIQTDCSSTAKFIVFSANVDMGEFSLRWICFHARLAVAGCLDTRHAHFESSLSDDLVLELLEQGTGYLFRSATLDADQMEALQMQMIGT